MIGGKVSKSNINVVLTTNVIKKQWGLQPTEEEKKIEDIHLKNKR